MASMSEPIRPTALTKNGNDGLFIDWSDGHRSIHTWVRLRKACPCAGCRDEASKPPDPFRILSPRELQRNEPPRPVQFDPIGHYAYKIVWNDGHDTGIYTLENLRSLCECPACTNRK